MHLFKSGVVVDKAEEMWGKERDVMKELMYHDKAFAYCHPDYGESLKDLMQGSRISFII